MPLDNPSAAAGGLSFFIPTIAGATGLWGVIAGTWAASGPDGDGFLGNTFTNSAAHAVNDKIRKKLVVPVSGVWKARMCANKNANAGIWSLQINTVEKGTWDMYDAVGPHNQWSQEISLGSLVAGTVYDLDMKVTGKNASSGGYIQYGYGVLVYQ